MEYNNRYIINGRHWRSLNKVETPFEIRLILKPDFEKGESTFCSKMPQCSNGVVVGVTKSVPLLRTLLKIVSL